MKFTDLLDELRVPWRTSGHHHCRPGWVQLDCPLCSKGQQRWRLGYNIAYGYMNCYACGRVRVGDALAELTGLDWRQLRGKLAGVERVAAPKPTAHTGKLEVPQGLQPLLPPHRAYLEERGYNVDYIQQVWGIQALAYHAEQSLRWRIWIPIYHHGGLVSWTTRAISAAATLRYKSAALHQEAVPHKSILYGADYARHGITVHEGPLDVWAVGPGSTCTFGVDYTGAQVAAIARYPVRAICFDNTPDGQRAARQLAADLAPFDGKTYNVTLDAKDAGSAGDHEIQQLRRHFLEV